MIIERHFGMPNRWTFKIKPIAEFLARYVGEGRDWIDPFCGMSTLAEHRNDLNPESPCDSHVLAADWLKSLVPRKFSGAIIDPPYSGRQVRECYTNLGREMKRDDSNGFFAGEIRRSVTPLIRPGGLVIVCGWNTNGIGMKYGFEMLEVLLVPHGGSHNDTIVTCERLISRASRFQEVFFR